MQTALEELRRQQDLLDRWNVFPVADGDTGRNMVATLQGAVDAVAALAGEPLSAVAAKAADGALMAARGNSGVILSQILQGLADGCQHQATIDPAGLKRALTRGAQRARQQVSSPVEGTILTVADAVADSADSSADVVDCLAAAVQGGEVALRATADTLPQLAHTQMVDSGALGYITILQGWLLAARGGAATVRPVAAPQRSNAVAENHFSSAPETNYYDVEALLYRFRCNNPSAVLAEKLAQVGDSIVIAPGMEVVKIHVHTDKLAALMEILTTVGDVRQMELLDMRHQVADRQRSAGLTVVALPDLHPLFEAMYPVADPDQARDEPDVFWIEPATPLSVAVGSPSVAMAGQAVLEYVAGDSWQENRRRLMQCLQRMKSWRVERRGAAWELDGTLYQSLEELRQILGARLGDVGVVTVYLSHTARREEAVFWQDAFDAALVQVPRAQPWMEIVWQP